MSRAKTRSSLMILGLGMLVSTSAVLVRAQENGTKPIPPDTPTENLGTSFPDPSVLDPLPEIEAKKFPVKVIKKSKSKNVYLLEDINVVQTKVGKILLLKREIEPYIAGRVIRTYPEKKQFAIKKLKIYENHTELFVGDAFVALEKMGDIIPETIDKTMPELTDQDQADLTEFEAQKKSSRQDEALTDPSPLDSHASDNESETSEYDPELDAGTTPRPLDDGAFDESEPEEEHNSLVIEEVNPIENNRHWVTTQFGYFRDLAYEPTAGTLSNAAGGIRYGYSLARMVFIKKPLLQDSIGLEGGAFLYKIFSYANQQDVYTVMPLLLTARYNLFVGHNLAFFLYSGVRRNFIVDSANSATDAIDLLAQTTFAGGAGMLIGIVSNWDVRLDAGLDMFGAGLVIRF